MPNTILFKAHTANRYAFTISNNINPYAASPYTPEPGLNATLVQNQGTPVTYTLQDSGQKTYTFDEDGRLLTYSDAQGHNWTYTYYANGKLDRITAEGGKYLDLGYNPQGRLQSVADHTGRSVSYDYDTNGDLDSFTDVLDQTWTYEYNNPNLDHFLTRVAAPGGVTVERQEYYPDGRAWKQYDGEDNLVVELTYPAFTSPQLVANFDFETGDLAGWTIVSGNAFSPLDVTNLSTAQGGNGQTFYQHGSYHLWGYKDGGDGQVGVLRSDTVTLPAHPIVRVLVGGGNDINNLYVALTRASDGTELFKATAQSSETYQQVEWDASTYAGEAVYLKVVDNSTGGWGHVNIDNVEIFDSLPSYSTTVTDALGKTTTHSYDSRGTLVGDANAAGELQKQYDFNFRPGLITDPLSNQTSLTWSDNGTNLEYIKDELDGETLIYYEDPDSPNSPTKITDPLGYDTTYSYTNADFPTLPTRIEYPLSFDGGATYIGTDYAYYPLASGASAGRVELITDALGNKTRYTYTSAGQIDTVTTGYQSLSPQTTNYDYDDLGRLTQVVDPAGVVTRNEYDAAGRLTKTIQNVHPTITAQNYQDKYNLITEYRYDLRGNQIAMIDTYGTITRTWYDLTDRPVTVVQNLYVNGTLADIDTPLGSIPGYNPAFPDRNLRTDTEYDDAGNVIATTDPAGIVTRTFYDNANRPNLTIQNYVGTGVYDPAYPDLNIRTETFYDANGNVIATMDTLGVITRTYYDELNRPKVVIQHLYINGTPEDINEPLQSVPLYNSAYPDRNLRTVTWYDANGNVILTADPKGILTRTYYDALNRPTSVVQNLGRTVTDALDIPTPPDFGVSDTNIRTDTYYDQAGNVIATVDPRGVVTRTYYDSANRPVATVQNLTGQDIYVTTIPDRASGGPDENVHTDIAYDSSGRRDTTTDPLGRVTKYEYNEVGQLSRVIGNFVNGGIPQNDENQRNIITAYEYDALGRQIKVTDTLNRVTLNAYDDLGHLLTSTQNYLAGQPQNYKDASGDQFNLKTTFTYDARGNQIAVTDTEGIVTRTYYDALGRPLTVVRNSTGPTLLQRGDPVDPLENLRTDTYYLGNGNVDYGLDEMGEKTDYAYDALGRLVAVQDPLLNTTGYGYDANGNRTTMTDAENVVTRYEYDNLNRLKAVIENYSTTQPANYETKVRTEYTYDAGGNRLSIRDGNSFLDGVDYRTIFTYDALGRLKTEKDALNNETVYGYDKLGNRNSLLDANGATTLFDYDELNRLTLINYPDPEEVDITFEYDAVGRRTDMDDGSGGFSQSTRWEYNNLDLPKLITDPFGTGISYDYDAQGNRTALSYGGQSYTYHYNDLNQLDEVAGSGLPALVEYGYDAAGRLKTVSRPNGVNTTYQYYDNGWLQDIIHAAGSETLASYQYQYYADGNRSQVTENVQNPQMALAPFPASYTSANRQPEAANFSVSYKPPSSKNQYASLPPQQVDFARLPLSFAANLGQFDKDVQFQTNALGGSIFFTPSEVVLSLVDKKDARIKDAEEASTFKESETKVVRVEFRNAGKNPVVEGLELLPGVANYAVGTDKKAWVADAPTYDGIVYRGLYPGVDLQYEGTGQSLKSTFTVAAGADPAVIQWRYKGAGNINLDTDGNLRVTLPTYKADGADTTLIEHAPIAWQEQDGQRIDVPVQFALGQNGEIRFVFPQGYNTALPLTIDPVLTYSTYLGNVGTDAGTAITTDASGNVYVTGYSWCGNFPTVDPLQQGGAGNSDIIISKLSADGSTLLYSTCVGGSGDDSGKSIALDAQGRIVVAGVTNSTDFPIVAGINSYGGGTCSSGAPCQDTIVVALNGTGSAIRYSTYLGGDGREEVGGVAVDGNGQIIVVGSSTSTNFPAVNAYDSTFGGGTCTSDWPCYDVTVTKLDPDLSGTSAILYSTYLGGSSRDKGYGVVLDSTGKVYLAGYSDSDGYPVWNALQSTRKGGLDIILSQLDPSLSGSASLLYSTYFGSSSLESGYAIARDASGNLYITGRVSSPRFPLRDALQYLPHSTGTCSGGGCYEAFVTKLNIATNTLIYSTYLGGTQNEEGYGIAVDSHGRAYVTGFTRSTDFPTWDPIQANKGADGCASAPCTDAFLSVLEPDGRSFAYSTYLGGDQDDIANGISIDSANKVHLVGETYSTNFPTTPGAYDVVNTQTTFRDAFISKVGALGAPTPPTYSHVDSVVNASSDDAEENASGSSVNLTSTELELTQAGTNQKAGLRFTGLALPQGAVIQNAWIQFTVSTSQASADATTLTFQAQAIDNALTFTASANNISSRTKTTASVNWMPTAWNTFDEGGPDQRTPNLAPVIQEVVDRPGWASGNALVIIITGSGKRVAKTFDRDPYGAAYLHIEYTLPAPPPTVTPTATPTATATFTPTATPTATPTPTATATATFTPTFTPTPIPSSPVTINYVYDPLNRLKEANYSNGDYHHYAYDAVGNRLSQNTMIGGLPSATSYLYDNANRIETVNGVTYTFDANGNLKNDGINAYDYDSANRLVSFTNATTTVTYQYSGLGDRLRDTVDGNPTTFTMDLNTGLTQALSDGTNTYIYGVGRIAQVNTDTEYFLGDALGSVRQMTDVSGEIIYVRAYDPYGVVSSTVGSSQTAYGYTGESYGDYNQLVYLRARHYAPGTSRFLTRDTWMGDYNRPMSLNRWMYVEGNPINFTDPSGMGQWCQDDFSSRADAAERYVNRAENGHLIQDYLNTYTAAGMGIQCNGSNINWHPLSTSGVGPAQVSILQINTPYGGNVGGYYAYGLRCWIGIQYGYYLLQNGIIVWTGDIPDCTICKTEDEMKAMDKDYLQHYQPEPPHNPNIPNWAVEYMRRRIKLVTDLCVSKGCSSTDLFIAAALAQNGPGFNRQNIIDLTVPKLRVNKGNATIDWWTYFGGANNADDTRDQLVLFVGVIKELEQRRWYIPNINWNTVDELSKIGD